MSKTTITGPMISAVLGTAVAIWIGIEKDKDGGWLPFVPPRYRPDILKKLREEYPAPEIEDISMRHNRIPFNRALLAIDYDNLHLYGIK